MRILDFSQFGLGSVMKVSEEQHSVIPGHKIQKYDGKSATFFQLFKEGRWACICADKKMTLAVEYQKLIVHF